MGYVLGWLCLPGPKPRKHLQIVAILLYCIYNIVLSGGFYLAVYIICASFVAVFPTRIVLGLPNIKETINKKVHKNNTNKFTRRIFDPKSRMFLKNPEVPHVEKEKIIARHPQKFLPRPSSDLHKETANQKISRRFAPLLTKSSTLRQPKGRVGFKRG